MQSKLFDEDLTELERALIETSNDPMIFDKKSLRLQEQINNTMHNLFIHGFLRCIHSYTLNFGLESTAAAIIRDSRIFKADLIRCQLETGIENEKMLSIIDKAFEVPIAAIDTMPGSSKEERLRQLFAKHFQIKKRNKFFKK